MELNDKLNTQGKIIATKIPSEFTAYACKDFNDYALQQKLVKGDIAFVPELVPLGEKAILELLANPTFQKEYGDNPMLFYYMVLQYALKTGLLLGAMWELNFDGLNENSYKIEVEHALNGETEKLLDEMGLNTEEKHDAFFVELFKRWNKLTAPYTQMEDQRFYITGAMFAGFQLGVTMILDNLED